MLAAYSDTAYDITLVLHILCAIVGFGAVILNGIYASQVRAKGGREGLAIFRANKLVSHIGNYFIYAVFVLGILLVLESGDAWSFGQTWVWLAMTLFIIALGISHGLLYPRVDKMEALMEEVVSGPPPTGGPPPQAAQMAALGKQIGIIAPLLDVFLVVIIALMVTKPH